ncbi:type I site-specific deoxyribonuclease, HsdR family protein [Candidatus Haloredivivus sp. G17]|nr:type I site-specific deoxyribonuclease, HsdR family protein [Candidatus Haloredivivus sp. G17]
MSSPNLKQKLSENAGETITTLIQKFQRDDDEEKFPLLSNDEDIYVMVDEAHRTQYDELANNMRTALPNAFYVGFTGTPIEKDKRILREPSETILTNTLSISPLKTR